ncbi:hypothetical protein LJC61_03615 [Ruminococcaceae bacterium OttesenSCG-928-A16]|nr:hypothetical protein [Ruminococcaceae bacterium OttesenSCG-928-A16]
MTTTDLLKLEAFLPAVTAEERAITDVYCADLLSWAMGNAPEDGAWCTVMGNVNAVAVAALADVAVIVLCENAELAEDAKQKAAGQGVNIVTTALPAFKAALAIAQAAGLVKP